MSSRIGMSRPLYSSGMGKAVLTGFTSEELDNYLEKTPLVAFAKNTITDAAVLKKDLAASKTRGYAIDDEEQENDGYCVAVKLEDKKHTIGAMSISFPKFRYTSEFEQAIVEKLFETKDKIEDRLK